MKICYIANPNCVHARRWVASLVEMGYEVHLVGCEPYSGTIPSGVVFHDLTRAINTRKVRFAVWGAMLYRLIRKIRPDVLHGHSVVGSGWLCAAAMWHPFVTTAHGSDLLLLRNKSFIQQWLAKWVMSSADRIICVSKQLYELAGELGVPENKRELLYLGIDTEVFRPGPVSSELRNSLDLGTGPIFFSIRAVRPIYNPIFICQAFCKVQKSIPAARLIIHEGHSDAKVLSDIKIFLEKNNAVNAVRFLPYVDDDNKMAKLYRLADASISVASSDGTPKSVQESMACGTPVIAADILALRHCINHEHDGLIVPDKDVDALAKAMIRLAEDRNLSEKMSKNAIKTICEQASIKAWLPIHKTIYESLV